MENVYTIIYNTTNTLAKKYVKKDMNEEKIKTKLRKRIGTRRKSLHD